MTFMRWRTWILIALAAWGASKMVVNDARILAFKSDHPIVHAAAALNERFDGTSHLNIVLTPRDESETGLFLRPDILRQVEQLEAYTETLEHVGGTHSLAGWVKRAHEKANEEHPDFFAIPDDTEEAKFYLDALSSDVPDDRPGMADLLGEIVDPTYSKTNLVVRMKSSQYIHQRPVIESLQAYLNEHFPENGPLHAQQSMILVPRNAPGVTVERSLSVFGYDDAPHGHGEVVFRDVRVPVSNILLGEGRGFEIAQGRLGPGRIHHCMRVIGVAERALEKMCQRLMTREAFGKKIYQHSVWEERIANARIGIECSRLLTLKTAHMMDTVGNKVARAHIAMIKVNAPLMALQILDDAIQAHGGGGVSDDFGLAARYAGVRTLRLADGPDEVHRRTIARIEFKRQAELSGIEVRR